MNAPLLTEEFHLLTAAPNGVQKLRELILSLAVRGKLVPQDAKDEPASELVKRIKAEKVKLAKSSKTIDAETGAVDAISKLTTSQPLGWVTSTLGEVVNIVRGITFPASEKSKAPSPGRIPCLRTSNIQDRIEWGDILYIKDTFVARPEQYVQHLDIVMSMANSRELVGKVALVESEISEPVTFGGFLGVIRPHLIDPRFVMALLRTPTARAELIDSASQTTNIANISLAKLRPLVIAIPPLAEQHRIVAKVDELMALCDQLEAQQTTQTEAHERLVATLLDTLTQSADAAAFADNWARIAEHFDLLFDTPESIDKLKQSVLQLAVQGKLVPQDAKDELAAKLLKRIQKSRLCRRKMASLNLEELEVPLPELPDSWIWTVIDQVAADSENSITDGPFGANLKTEHYIPTEGCRVIRLQNIGRGLFRGEHCVYVDSERYKRLSKHHVQAGDLVVAGLVDEGVRCCILPPDIGPALVKADCYRFSVHPELVNEFALHYLNSPTSGLFASAHHHGMTLTRIGLGNFRQIPYPLPPLAEQHRIVAKVDELMAVCDALATRLTAARELSSKLVGAVAEAAVA